LQVRRFHNVFLSFDAGPTKTVFPAREQLQAEKDQLLERLEELQALSADQSDILCRLVPRHDHLEARYAQVKKERHILKRQLDIMEDQNWDLRFSCFDAAAKLDSTKADRANVELQLEEAVAENHDLHEIWDSLEEQLEVTKRKRKACKAKLMQKLQETGQQLDSTQEEVNKAKHEKELLQGQLSRFRVQVSKLKEVRKEMRKNTKKKKRTKSKHRMPKVNMIA
jgi:chromosome segregation ATPase